ncbi:MAG: hypothetical protein ACRD3Q_17895 [Terriglobales bacterium]
MKSPFRLIVRLLLIALACSLGAVAAPSSKDNNAKEKQSIDSGSFGVFMNGHRVGTEKFSIDQMNTGSIIKSEFRTDNDPNTAVQQSALELTAAGDIRRYEWNELAPGKAHSVITPNDQFLNQKWVAGPGEKEHEQPYLLPPSTSILDDYFFIHREVLVWRFLASTCKQENSQVQCPLKQRAQFGTLNPRQHASSPLAAEYLGREKISYKGNQQEFNKVELKTETGSWFLWLDEGFKVMRIVIEGDNTEVVRD